MGVKKSNKSGNQRGLKRAGTPNLKKLDDGGYQNQHGVYFTEEEKKALVSKVNSAMAKRKKILTEKSELTRTIFGVKQHYKVGDDVVSNDFIMAKKSKSLQQFKSKKAYEVYMDNLARVTKKDYINNKLQIYKDNYIKAIENTFGSDGDLAKEKIQNMKIKDFSNFMARELFSGIQYIYSDEEYELRLEQLNAVVGVET